MQFFLPKKYVRRGDPGVASAFYVSGFCHILVSRKVHRVGPWCLCSPVVPSNLSSISFLLLTSQGRRKKGCGIHIFKLKELQDRTELSYIRSSCSSGPCADVWVPTQIVCILSGTWGLYLQFLFQLKTEMCTVDKRQKSEICQFACFFFWFSQNCSKLWQINNN